MSMEGWEWVWKEEWGWILKGGDEHGRVGISMKGLGWVWKGGDKYGSVGMSMEGWG